MALPPSTIRCECGNLEKKMKCWLEGRWEKRMSKKAHIMAGAPAGKTGRSTDSVWQNKTGHADLVWSLVSSFWDNTCVRDSKETSERIFIVRKKGIYKAFTTFPPFLSPNESGPFSLRQQRTWQHDSDIKAFTLWAATFLCSYLQFVWMLFGLNIRACECWWPITNICWLHGVGACVYLLCLFAVIYWDWVLGWGGWEAWWEPKKRRHSWYSPGWNHYVWLPLCSNPGVHRICVAVSDERRGGGAPRTCACLAALLSAWRALCLLQRHAGRNNTPQLRFISSTDKQWLTDRGAAGQRLDLGVDGWVRRRLTEWSLLLRFSLLAVNGNKKSQIRFKFKHKSQEDGRTRKFCQI